MDFAEKINQLNIDGVYPFHMPGHKRNIEALGGVKYMDRAKYVENPYFIDITEIDGYDNLHRPTGMIAELEERIAAIWGAYRSYVLVNGSTCGILAAISAAAGYGDTLLMARNSHKAAYNGLCIRGLEADYVYPEYDEHMGINLSVTPKAVAEALVRGRERGKTYKAVYITSPTYEGVVSDISRIADIVHSYGAILIVDEAHGAHFGLSDRAPKSAVTLGADMVVQSIHKTLPAMTQTAILHIGRGYVTSSGDIRSGTSGGDAGNRTRTCRVDIGRLEYFLSLYQTSSPSYVLMASVDRCVRMLEDAAKREELFTAYYDRLDRFYDACKGFSDIRIWTPDMAKETHRGGIFGFDQGKLIIFSGSGAYSGLGIYDVLREKYRLQPEMSLNRHCLAMTSCMDSDEGFRRLGEALAKIDENIVKTKLCRSDEAENMRDIWNICALDTSGDIGQDICKSYISGQQRPISHCTIAAAFEADKIYGELREGEAAGDYVYVYPPGIPFIVPGEIITKEIICDIMRSREQGYEVSGAEVSDGRLYMNLLR